jgi:small subunit ribosomal protein S17
MPRRVLEGVVTSDKMEKTVTVQVERRTMHPVYKKFVKMSKKYAAHDEGNQFKIGDRVSIEECKPISKNKTWTVITKSTAPKNASRIRAVNADAVVVAANKAGKTEKTTTKKAKKA